MTTIRIIATSRDNAINTFRRLFPCALYRLYYVFMPDCDPFIENGVTVYTVYYYHAKIQN